MIEAMLMGGGMGSQIESIQTINVAERTSTLFYEYTISDVDPDKTFVIMNQQSSPSGYTYFCQPFLYSSTRVRVIANKTSEGAVIPASVIFVVSHRSGLVVRRGFVNMSYGQNYLTAGIASGFDPNKSFCIVHPMQNDTSASFSMSSAAVSTDISSGSGITINRSNPDRAISVLYELVEFL